MWESNGPGIVGNDVGDLVGADGFLDNFTKLEVGFSALDADESESALFIIQESIVLSSLDHIEDVHDTNWELMVSSDFMINFKSCLFILCDNCDLFTVSGQSESVSGIKLKLT